MKKIIKLALATSSLIIFSTVLTPVSNAAPNKSFEKINCKNTKAKGHTAKIIDPPEIKGPFQNRTFTLTTNCGNIVIKADGKSAPITVTALSALANGGFFDQTLCHRLTTEDIYALQCGDPTATGLGGPNFTYRDENLPNPVENNYPAGVVAMHNSGQDTNGSQFFIFYADTSLPPSYTIWGKVTKGLEIIQMVAKSGVLDGKKDGAPKLKIGIEKVKVR
jgi:peptidyl-prolyl cis-trans isomerase B (cyclophilin B)